MKLVRNLTLTSLLAFAIGWNAYGIYAVVPTVEQPAPVEVSFNEPQEPVIDINQMHCLATNIYHEARGESDVGKIAVAHVTLNRTFSEYYPDTICDVVYQARLSRWWLENKGREVPVRNQCQFSWYCDGRSDAVDANSQGWKDSVYIWCSCIKGESCSFCLSKLNKRF